MRNTKKRKLYALKGVESLTVSDSCFIMGARSEVGCDSETLASIPDSNMDLTLDKAGLPSGALLLCLQMRGLV
jgi:hypothetical protein